MVLNYKLFQAEKVLLTHTTVSLTFFHFLVCMELYLQSMAVRQRVSLHRIWKESVKLT